MSDYTPTTEELREYIEGGGDIGGWGSLSVDQETARVAAFDRWLTAHEAKFFTADEIRQMVEDNTDRQGNLYRIDFLSRLRHEEQLRVEHEPNGQGAGTSTTEAGSLGSSGGTSKTASSLAGGES